MPSDKYCNSCKYAYSNNICSCEKYSPISDAILNGGLCIEYIRHKDKELSQALAEQLDYAISSRFEFSNEEANSMSRTLKHSQCKDCLNENGFDTCKVFNTKPANYARALVNEPCPHKTLSLESRIKGALYGFAIGDAMGATTEFMTSSEIKKKYGVLKDIIGGGWLNLTKGEVTDDTQMTFCVCKALKETINIPRRNNIHNINLYQRCCDYFVEWYNTNPVDIGNCCREIISSCKNYDFKEWIHRANNPNSLGNGSLMRSMPLVLANESLETALTIGRLTHNNKTCDDCIEEYYLILKQCIDGELDKIPLGLKLKDPSGHVNNTISNAEYWLFETESFEDAIIGAVNHGGDADTIAAITGSLSGAYYGYNSIPTKWICDLNTETKQLLDEYAVFFTLLYKG